MYSFVIKQMASPCDDMMAANTSQRRSIAIQRVILETNTKHNVPIILRLLYIVKQVFLHHVGDDWPIEELDMTHKPTEVPFVGVSFIVTTFKFNVRHFNVVEKSLLQLVKYGFVSTCVTKWSKIPMYRINDEGDRCLFRNYNTTDDIMSIELRRQEERVRMIYSRKRTSVTQYTPEIINKSVGAFNPPESTDMGKCGNSNPLLATTIESNRIMEMYRRVITYENDVCTVYSILEKHVYTKKQSSSSSLSVPITLVMEKSRDLIRSSEAMYTMSIMRDLGYRIDNRVTGGPCLDNDINSVDPVTMSIPIK